MEMSVDIYQCGSKHIHVILHGDAEGIAAFTDYESFIKFVEACQQFISNRAKVPEAFLDAFKDEGNPR